MRLGQLARKLGLRPVEIVDFLAGHQIPIDDNANTKLPDDQVTLIIQQFAAGQAETIGKEPDEPQDPDVTKTSIANDTANEDQKSNDASNEIPAHEFNPEGVELIKAPKVELPGLKVVGKIELPDIKKKEPLPEQAESSTTDPAPEVGKKLREENRKPYPQKRERSNQSRINPIALQREREAKEADKKRQTEAEREKEKRKEYYHKKVKAAPPTKRVRMVEEPVEEFTAAELRETPKSLWGKFKRWMKS